MRRALAAALLLAAVAAPEAAALPSPERLKVKRHVVALPESVKAVSGCSFTRGGREGVLCQAELAGVRGRHVVGLRPDGSHFRCITCAGGIPGRAHKIFAFPDGRRFLLGTLPSDAQNADEGASLTVHVGECERTLPDCGRLRLRRVELPAGTASLNDREVRLSPDGRKLVYTIVRPDGFVILMGDLVPAGEGYEVRDARVLNPAPNPTTADDFARRGAFAEAKSFRDEHTLVYASTEQQGSNLDVYRMDLRTGASTRVTSGGEWDEDADYDPRGRYLAVGTTRRNYNVLRGATVVPLPPFLDAVKTVFLARFKLANLEERRRALETWVTDEAGERDGRYGGRQLSDQRGGWDARMPVSWSPDGTRIVWTDQGPGTLTRLVIARLPDLRPVEPECPGGACRTPTPEWAPRIADYPVVVPGVRALPGPGGGVAVLTFGGIVAGGQVRIDYRDYASADRGVILNGSEVGDGFAFRDLRIDYRADVVASGREAGRYRADLFGVGRRACGTVEGSLGARSERTVYGRADPGCGFPPPAACGNRRDDDGDGLEDLTDGGCTSEEDASEAGPRLRTTCVPRVIPDTATRPRGDGALELAVPGRTPVDLAVARRTRRGERVVARYAGRLIPAALQPGRLRAGRYVVRFRSGRATQADAVTLRRGRFRRARQSDRAACGLLRRATLAAPSRGLPLLRVRTRRPARIRVQILRGRRVVARRALGTARPRRDLRQRLRLPRRGRVTVRVLATRRGRTARLSLAPPGR